MGCLIFSGEGGKSLSFCFYRLKKLFFKLYLLFYCKFYCPLLLCLDYYIDLLFLLYCLKKGALLFIKRIKMWMPEANKYLGEMVDRHSLQI